MKYVEVSQFGNEGQLRLFDGDAPRPEAGQLLLDVKAAGINFADIMARRGNYPPISSAPYRPGFEVVGTVKVVGPETPGFAVGDLVVSLSPGGGGYASEVAVPAMMAHKLPTGFDPGTAAGLFVQGMTAYFMLKAASLKSGETVLVSAAAGGVGSMAVQMATLLGAKVIGLSSKSKHDDVMANGAIAAIDYREAGWSKKVIELTDGKGVDVYLDAEGNLGGEAFDALGRKSRWIVYGILNEATVPFPLERQWEFIFKNVSLRGYTIDTDFDKFGPAIQEAVRWVEDGKLQVKVTGFALSEVQDAHRAIAARKTLGKVVLLP
jgi:NADPH:quinone reductase